MQAKNIFLVLFFINLLILCILSQVLEPREVKIKDVSKSNLDESVKIIGKITEFQNKANLTIIKIVDETGIINGVIYEKISFEKEKNYLFYGKIKEYNQDLEVEIEKITGG
jgi:RecJ-like exonuclease